MDILENEEKTVLVQLQTATGNRNRPVTFSGGAKELLVTTKDKFKDVLKKGQSSEIYLQILDKSWGEDLFVDLIDQDIPARSTIRAVENINIEMTGTIPTINSPPGIPNTGKSDVSSVVGPFVQAQLNLSLEGLSLIVPTDPEIPSLDIDKVGSNKDAIEAEARIYKTDTRRSLTDYQLKINEAAQKICVINPSKLRNRLLLLEEARLKVNETYHFKKGKSRSKRHCLIEPTTPKRPKIGQTTRLTRMKVLEQDIKNIDERISYKQKRRQMAEDSKNYRTCDEVTEEIGELIKQKRQMAAELKVLSKKDRNSQRYFKRKGSSNESPQSSRTNSPFPTSDSDTSNNRLERSNSHDTLSIISDTENTESLVKFVILGTILLAWEYL